MNSELDEEPLKHIDSNETFSYSNPNKNLTTIASEKLNVFLKSFIVSIVGMKIAQKDINLIFKSSACLVAKVNEFNKSLIKDNNGLEVNQAIQTSTAFVQSHLLAVSSRHRRNKIVASNPLYVTPKEVAIGTRWESRKKTIGGKVLKIPRLIQSSFQYISVTKTITALFDNRQFCDEYFKYNVNRQRDHVCTSGKYEHFCCGTTFKEIALFREHPESLQLHVASDEYEPCESLGSKSNRHKICAVYFSIDNLPVKFLSKCKSVFLVALCNSDEPNMKYTDFNDIWYPMVNEIKELETKGIEVIGRPKKLLGTLTKASFDNLGANYALGYVKSFSSTFFCRHCVSDAARTSVKEDPTQIRTIEMYEKQIDIVDESTKVDFSETKGVKSYCILSDLKYFHIISNPTCDVMHDLNEGAIPFVLKVLFEQIIALKLLKLEQLSMSIQLFDYGLLDRRNIPSPIVDLNKKSLGQNAGQSMCLIRNIPFILSRFRGHVSLNEIWNAVLLRIINIVYSPKLIEDNLINLEKEITKFSKLMLKFTSKIKPKIHFMQHYPRIIRRMGPILHMNMFKFERKHKELKALQTRNFKNVNQTVAKKHQQALCLNGVSFIDDVQRGHMKPINNNHPHIDFLAAIFENDISAVNELKFLNINSYDYRKDLFVVNDTKFHQIECVYVKGDNHYLQCKSYTVKSFDVFLNSFEIEQDEFIEFEMFNVDSLKHSKTYEMQYLLSKQYIKAETVDISINKTSQC